MWGEKWGVKTCQQSSLGWPLNIPQPLTLWVCLLCPRPSPMKSFLCPRSCFCTLVRAESSDPLTHLVQYPPLFLCTCHLGILIVSQVVGVSCFPFFDWDLTRFINSFPRPLPCTICLRLTCLIWTRKASFGLGAGVTFVIVCMGFLWSFWSRRVCGSGAALQFLQVRFLLSDS